MLPEIQEKLYKEIMLVMDESVELTREKLMDMKYLDMVVKETMRLCK